MRMWKLKLRFGKKQIILQYWIRAWLNQAPHWNSALVKQRAGYGTLEETDSFSHIAEHSGSSVFWTKTRYFISQLGCCIGQISATIILCGPHKGKELCWWTTVRLLSCSMGQDIMNTTMHKAAGRGHDAPHISHSATSSNMGTWVMVYSRQVAGQRGQATPGKDTDTLYPCASSAFHWPWRITEPSSKSRGQQSVHLPGGTAESLDQETAGQLQGESHKSARQSDLPTHNTQICPVHLSSPPCWQPLIPHHR